MPRTKKRRRRRRNSTTQLPPGAQGVRPPKTRLKALFELLVEVPITAERAVFTMPLPEAESPRRLVMFDSAMLVRGTNALKAVRLLCEQAHWEFAAGILRQLFELVINMEHLARQPDPRSRDVPLRQVRPLPEGSPPAPEPALRPEDRPLDTERLAILGKMLDETFPEFRRVDEKGKLSLFTPG